MSSIEKIQRYIEKHGVRNLRYDMSTEETLAIIHEMTEFEAVNLAFKYGQAKGCRMAKAAKGAAV